MAFLEDTLLPADLLRDVLRTVGALHASDRLWVSHELEASKADGGAWLEVARLLGGLPPTWTHVGHDPSADVRTARRAGVRASLLDDAAPTRYETLLDDACATTGGLSGLLAGAARSTRLRLGRERPLMPPDRSRVVAGVAGPLLAGYVLWCLRQAAEAGLPRLYFVARDGEVMLSVARRLARSLGPAAGGDVELRYLHGSRRAWLRDAPDEGLLRSVLGRQERLSVRDGLAWSELAPEDVADELAAAGLDDHDAPLDEDGRRPARGPAGAPHPARDGPRRPAARLPRRGRPARRHALRDRRRRRPRQHRAPAHRARRPARRHRPRPGVLLRPGRARPGRAGAPPARLRLRRVAGLRGPAEHGPVGRPGDVHDRLPRRGHGLRARPRPAAPGPRPRGRRRAAGGPRTSARGWPSSPRSWPRPCRWARRTWSSAR